MRYHLYLTALALPLLLVSAAPSSAAPEAAPPAAAAAAPAKVPGPPELAWKDMSEDQKVKFMKAVVTPKMKVAFQEFDGEAFKKFNCQTCHGKDAKERKFKMPGTDVKALPSTPDGFKAAMAKNPTWPKFTKFMADTVKPQMATLLGLPEFDPKKPEAGGFGCQNCHMMEKATLAK
jgi:mono/diheme cytochrome c family protein